MIITDNIRFYKKSRSYKGFLSTYITIVYFNKRTAAQIIDNFKKIPLINNIQYNKRKYRDMNQIAVSFKSEADESAFLLLTSTGIKVSYEIGD